MKKICIILILVTVGAVILESMSLFILMPLWNYPRNAPLWFNKLLLFSIAPAIIGLIGLAYIYRKEIKKEIIGIINS